MFTHQLHNLSLGARHPKSVFLVELPRIFTGTAASGEETVEKTVSTVEVVVVEEEPKHLSLVLIAEPYGPYGQSVFLATLKLNDTDAMSQLFRSALGHNRDIPCM